MVSINVTAMRRYHDQLLPLAGADVLCLQETRLTAPAQRAMASLAKEAHWQCFWGCPQDSRTGGVWDPPPGGTGILVKAGWPARKVEIREDDQLAQRLWHSGRWVHVHICLGSGAVALNIMCVYGVSSNPTLNAQLWSQLLEYRARLGVAPCLIFADANFDLDAHAAYPKDVLTAVLQGNLIDLDHLHSATAGVPTCCAYETSPGSKTRIDGALADARTASTLTNVRARTDLLLPGHRAVEFSFDLARASQSVSKMRKFPDLPAPVFAEAQAETLAEGWVAQHLLEWEALSLDEAPTQATLDSAWALWSWVAEEAALALAYPPAGHMGGQKLPLAPRKWDRGRGTDRALVQAALCPAKSTPSGGAVAPFSLCLTAAQGCLRHLQHWAKQANRPAALPAQVLQNWEALRRRVKRLNSMSLPVLWAELPLPPAAPRLDAPSLDAIGRDLDLMGKRWVRQAETERVREWKNGMDKAWAENTSLVYRWLKQDYSPPLVVLTRPDGSLTGDLQEMDTLLQDAWFPIMRKYAGQPEPSVPDFLAAYGRHLQCHPMASTEITGRRLRRRIAKMSKTTAKGLDAWGVRDLARLPLIVLDLLAQLLAAVERTGRWPGALTRGYISLVPKGEGSLPLQMRPLSVLSAVYRLWAGLRLEEATLWQERWVYGLAFAFRPATGSLDAASLLSVMTELARAQGWKLAGAALDYVKCFDMVPVGIVLACAAALGFAEGPLRAIAGMYSSLRRSFKMLGCLGEPFAATNGILQGCPLSVILINILTTIWMKEIARLHGGIAVRCAGLPPPPPPPPPDPAPAGEPPPGAGQREDGGDQRPREVDFSTMGYADDTYMHKSKLRELRGPLGTTAEWLRLTQQGVNPKKSLCFSLEPAGQRRAAAVQLGGESFPFQREFRVLGIGIRMTAAVSTGPLLQKRLAKGRVLLSRLHGVQGSSRRKAFVTASLILAAGAYGVEVAPVSPQDLRGLDAAIMREVWGTTRPGRAQEIVFCVLHPGHLVSASMRRTYLQLCWLARAARTAGPLQVAVQARWEHDSFPPPQGPVGRALQTLHLLGWLRPSSWWEWEVAGRQGGPLLVTEGTWGAVRHEIREGLRCHHLTNLEARRPRQFGGLGGHVEGALCRSSLDACSSGLRRGLLEGLLAGATWTADRAHRRRMIPSPRCPYCSTGDTETEDHILWVCRAWAECRGPRMPDLLRLAACAGLPALPSAWPPCLRLCGLPPRSLAATAPMGTFPPFVLALHLFMCDILEIRKLRDEHSGNPPLFASRPPSRGYPMRELVGPLPRPEPLPIAVRNMAPSEWGWERAFLVDLLLWLAQLQWMPPGAGQVTFIELALDFEATAGRALPPTPQSSLQGVPLSLHERARVLRVALVALKKHSAGPPPFPGVFVNRAFSLVPLGAGPQAGLSRRPYFVSRGAMARQLEALQAYSERRIARNRCRVPQDSRAPQQAAAPQLPHQPGVQPQPPAALADPAPPLVAPQPAKGGARRSRNCFASDYTPPAGDAPQGAAFALRVRQRPYGALPVWRLPKPGAPHRPALPLPAPQPRPAAERRPAPPGGAPPDPAPAPLVPRALPVPPAPLAPQAPHPVRPPVAPRNAKLYRCGAHDLPPCKSCFRAGRGVRHCCKAGHHRRLAGLQVPASARHLGTPPPSGRPGRAAPPPPPPSTGGSTEPLAAAASQARQTPATPGSSAAGPTGPSQRDTTGAPNPTQPKTQTPTPGGCSG